MTETAERSRKQSGVPESQRCCPVCDQRSWKVWFEQRDVTHGLGEVFTIVRCAGCGLVSYEPFPDEETLRTYYPPDYYAFREGDDARELAGFRLLLDDLHLGIRRNLPLAILLSPLLWYKEVHSAARFLRRAPRGRLLDVGCGDGAFLAKAGRMGFECAGLEPGGGGPDRIRVAGKDIPIFRGSLHDFWGQESSFDLITLNHVFEHLPDPRKALEKLKTLLKPNGRILIRMPRTDHLLFQRRPFDCYQLETPRHVYLYTRQNFAKLAARCGLNVVDTSFECFPTHYQYTLKKILFGKSFLSPHWLDSRICSMILLPVCALLKLCGQADCMAVWLGRDPVV